MVNNMKTDFEIITPRLILRAPRMEDAHEVNAAINENWRELQKWMSWTAEGQNALSATEHYISVIAHDLIEKGGLPLHGFCRETGKYVISTGIHLDGDDFATGYMVSLPFQGKGYATEGCNAVIRYAFNAMNVPAVHIAHYEGNAGSERVIRKLGFTESSVRPKAHARHLDGTLLDVHEYVMTDPGVLPALQVEWRRRCP